MCCCRLLEPDGRRSWSNLAANKNALHCGDMSYPLIVRIHETKIIERQIQKKKLLSEYFEKMNGMKA